MFEKEAEELYKDWYAHKLGAISIIDVICKMAEFSYNKAQEEFKGKCKTSYIKGIRTMANALKDYDRTDGAWTDYFEHKVDEVLKRLLKESE